MPPGSLRTDDNAAHRARELVDDREAEPRSDGSRARVARVEEEALERARHLVGLEAGAFVLDREQARARDDADGAAGR